MGVTVTEIVSGTGDVQGLSAQVGLRLVGYSVRESAVVPILATVALRDGTSDAGEAVVVIGLLASTSQTVWLGDYGLPCNSGVFVDRISGTSHLSLWTKVIP